MVDVHESKKVALHRLVLQDEKPAFLSLRWDDAIEAYNRMDIPRQREFVRVIEEYSGRSRKARELLIRALRERSLELINKALDEGTDLRVYMQNIEQFANDMGVSVNNPAYLQNVFRTNLQTAYSAGRWRAMNDPDVIEQMPYWQYRATNDARTCDFCRYMDGRIFEKGNSATDFLVPPCHYQSRSQAVTYELEQGDRVEKSPPSGYANRTGYIADFGHNPTDLLRI